MNIIKAFFKSRELKFIEKVQIAIRQEEERQERALWGSFHKLDMAELATKLEKLAFTTQKMERLLYQTRGKEVLTQLLGGSDYDIGSDCVFESEGNEVIDKIAAITYAQELHSKDSFVYITSQNGFVRTEVITFEDFVKMSNASMEVQDGN